MVTPVLMYSFQSWTVKKAECQRVDAFKLQCWRRVLRTPWAARRSSQSILREINPDYSLEGLMLKLKQMTLVICCEQLTHWKRPWCWERLRAEEESIRGWDGWMALLMQWTWTWANFRRCWGTERPAMLQSMGLQRVGQNWGTEQQQYLLFQDVKLYFYSSYNFTYVLERCTHGGKKMKERWLFNFFIVIGIMLLEKSQGMHII